MTIVLHPVATTFKKGGKTYAHHIVHDHDALGYRSVTDKGERVTFCVEHLVTNCVHCGRSPGQHEVDEKYAEDSGRAFDCPGYEEKKACKCNLPKPEGVESL